MCLVKLVLTMGGGMEAQAGIEPANEGFADPCLTTWLLGHGKPHYIMRITSLRIVCFRIYIHISDAVLWSSALGNTC